MTPRYPERRALYAGSFNPFTLGHLSILRRAAELFDHITVAIGVNVNKPVPSSLPERMEAITAAIAQLPVELAERCSVTSYTGELTVDYARSIGARWLVRGARSASEFEDETTLADINRRLADIETVIFPALPELTCCSSSLVRELLSYGHDASQFLP